MPETTPALTKRFSCSAATVLAILAGRKTQHRQPAKLTENNRGCSDGLALLAKPNATPIRDGIGLVWRPYGSSPEIPMTQDWIEKFSPVGKPGDRLAVREAFKIGPTPGGSFADFMMGRAHTITYRADEATRLLEGDYGVGTTTRIDIGSEASEFPMEKYGVWQPRRTMPAWATRIILEITAVRFGRPEAADPWAWTVEFKRIEGEVK